LRQRGGGLRIVPPGVVETGEGKRAAHKPEALTKE
jgi:hypothetical protein